jgi:hypothetical protein
MCGARSRLQRESERSAHGREWRREATVDQTLMSGLATARPWFTSGFPLSQVAQLPVWRAESQRELSWAGRRAGRCAAGNQPPAKNVVAHNSRGF